MKKLSCLLLLLLLSLPLFSDVLLTDQEYNQIMEALETSEAALMNSRQNEATLKLSLENSEQKITLLEDSLTISEMTIELLLKASQTQSGYSKEQRLDRIFQRAGDIIIGAGAGYITAQITD